VDWKDRVAHNESLFREVNERIEAGHGSADRSDPAAFRCECGSLRCNMLVELTLSEYERVRATSTHFFVVPGHEIPEVERVIERAATFVVVEKVGESAHVARERDPRADAGGGD